MLHQSPALLPKVMLPDAVDGRTLRLNDFNDPGEMTLTAQARASNRNVLGMTQKYPLNKDGGDGFSRTAGRAAPGRIASPDGWRF